MSVLLGFALLALLTAGLCVSVGSVTIPFGQIVRLLIDATLGLEGPPTPARAIILDVRLPRILCVALSGAALSLCGASMQGLLRNPLADGSTLGVSSGASLGAVLAIAFGAGLPGLPQVGVFVSSVVFAFLSMILILALSYSLDGSLATNTIILIGVVFSMFAGSLTSLVLAFSSEKLRPITFWTLGSLSGSTYGQALVLLSTLGVCGSALRAHARELNAFAIGEENAHHIGVPVRRVKLLIMVSVSLLIGVSVAIGGTIGFVGLVMPHIVRLLFGPNHRRLLPASAFFGAVFLMLCDMLARTLLSPMELPLGVITSLIGASVFTAILFRQRRERQSA